MLEFLKKWGPAGLASVAGAAAADAVLKDRHIALRIVGGAVVCMFTLYGAHRVGLVKVG